MKFEPWSGTGGTAGFKNKPKTVNGKQTNIPIG